MRKANGNKKIAVTISVDPEQWENLGKRCVEMQQWLNSKGVTKASTFTRSALVRECVGLASRPEYLAFIKMSIGEIYGVDASQQELFKD